MFTIAAQNVHQATPAVLALMKAEALNLDARGYVLPVPLTTIFFRPRQRVSLWAELGLNPFRLFLDGLSAMGPRPLGVIDGAETELGGILSNNLTNIVERLRTAPLSSVLLPARSVNRVRHVHVSLNADRALDLFVVSTDADLVTDVLGADPVRWSFVQELIASQLEVPVGVLYHVAAQARVSCEAADRLFDLPDGPLKEDPWTTEDGEEVRCRDPLRLVGLPLGRWTRELSFLLAKGPDGPPGHDPWLEGVARPLWKAWKLSREPVHDAIGAAQGALVGVVARDWAQAAWEWLEAQRGTV